MTRFLKSNISFWDKTEEVTLGFVPNVTVTLDNEKTLFLHIYIFPESRDKETNYVISKDNFFLSSDFLYSNKIIQVYRQNGAFLYFSDPNVFDKSSCQRRYRDDHHFQSFTHQVHKDK